MCNLTPAAIRIHGRAGSISKRGAWVEHNGMHRCTNPACRNLFLGAICQRCGTARVCAWCNHILLGDNRRGPKNCAPHSHDTHGICKECSAEMITNSMRIERDKRKPTVLIMESYIVRKLVTQEEVCRGS